MSEQRTDLLQSRKVSRRSFLHLSGVTLGGALLAACTPVAAPATSGGGETAEQITLRFQNWFNESDMHTWQIGLDRFAEEHPEVEMKLEFASWGDTVSTIMAGAAAGNLPDIFMASDEHVPPPASVELVLDLNPFIEREPDVNVDDFAEGVSRGFNIWGHWWGFAYDQSTWGIYYNKGLFDEAGLDYPPGEGGDQWTLDEFVEVAKALTKPDGEQWGVLTNGSQYLNSAFIYSAGGRNFDDDGRECLINSPEAAEGLQFLVDLVHVHKVAPTAAELAGGGIDYFASGLAAMEFQGQWSLQSKNAEVEFDFDIGYLPIGKNKVTVTGGSGFCAAASTANPDIAWAFLKSYTSSETLADMVGRPGRGIPARWSATPAYLEAGGKAEHPSAFIEQLGWAFNDRATLASPEYGDSFSRHYGAIYETGEGDIAEAIATIAEETNAALEEKWKTVTLDI
ncbi:sugar ABC transporter substrate-binding protein [Chloroflexi bacterium TSY]|nr:sugar ABC transporter substrate-binding protein [Chloroflexi bacterium TSY]